jgi:Na+-driven multidrug efflux pump
MPGVASAAAPASGRSQVCAYLRMAAVITATLLVDLTNSYAAVAVVGHAFPNDPAILAGVSVGNMLFNICLLSTSYGLASGLDTLLSQAHGAFCSLPFAARAGRPHPGRTHVQGTCLLLLLGWVPLAALCIFSGPVLHFLGQPHEVAEKAGAYAR